MSENNNNENIEFIDLASEMRQSFLEYAMSVIVSRALPDVKDGLKPVHRRIIYSMFDMKIDHTSSYKKSARIVGEVMGKYHPHGDSAIYSTMVRMGQDFSYRYPLVDGHGNFGSIDGDEPAAMRYTEARMSKISSELVLDLDKNTVPFINNYDGTEKEPDVLTSYIPNLLINGSSGIAVGMTTSIPPFNLNEVIDCCIALLKDEEITEDSLIKFIKGPDFPTGAIVSNRKKINESFIKGKGQITIRSKHHFETKNKRELLIFTEIPYQVNKSNILKKIAELVKENVLVGIKDLRDESNREGIRILIELKKDSQKEVLLNKLYKHTPLQTKFSINMLALENKRPKLLNLKSIIRLFNDHRFDILVRKSKFELEKSQKKQNILNGLVIALNNIDIVIEIIKKSQTTSDASNKLMEKFNLNFEQSKAILEMRLQRLTGLEVEKIKKELKELEIKINELKELIANKEKQVFEIINKLKEIKNKYGDERRTEISDISVNDISDEALILDKKTLVILTKNNYIKRMTFDEMKVQKRGGTGITCLNTPDDTVHKILSCSTLDDILLFSNLGKVYRKKAYQIEKFSRTSHGIPIINLLDIEKDEKIISIFKIDKEDKNENLVLVSKKGIIKKIKLFSLDKIRRTGKRIINFDENDSLANIELLQQNQNIILFSSAGKAVQFLEKELPVYSTSAKGVKGINLKGSNIVSLCVVDENEKLVLVSSNGIGKLINSKDIKHTHRGSTGVKIMNIDVNNLLFSAKPLAHNANVLLTSDNNNILIFKSDELPTLSRTAKGVKLMNLKEGSISSLDLLTMEE